MRRCEGGSLEGPPPWTLLLHRRTSTTQDNSFFAPPRNQTTTCRSRSRRCPCPSRRARRQAAARTFPTSSTHAHAYLPRMRSRSIRTSSPPCSATSVMPLGSAAASSDPPTKPTVPAGDGGILGEVGPRRRCRSIYSRRFRHGRRRWRRKRCDESAVDFEQATSQAGHSAESHVPRRNVPATTASIASPARECDDRVAARPRLQPSA